MRKIIICLMMMGQTCCLFAKSFSMWNIGLRAGGNAYVTSSEVNGKIGYGGDLDIGFTNYWTIRHSGVGFHTGLSFGYCTSRFSSAYSNQFTNYDYLGNKIIYTTSADKVELNITKQIQMEIPLMLAIRKNHVFFNIGGKFMMPLQDTYKQSVEGVMIDAYYEKPDVHVINRLITGASDDAAYSGTNCLPKYNVLVGAEIGYEWLLRNNSILGLGVYADYSVWNSHKVSQTKPIIEVEPITNPNYPPAQVTINPLVTTSMSKLLYCDFGVKLYYGFTGRGNRYDCHCIRR